jgi:hypothetical protein
MRECCSVVNAMSVFRFCWNEQAGAMAASDLVKKLTSLPAILPGLYHVPQSLQSNSGVVPQNRSKLLSNSCILNYS